jgi:tetratricopeptide (TPR) repeat protein
MLLFCQNPTDDTMKLLTLLIVLMSALPATADFDELVKNGDVHDTRFEFDKALEFYLPAEKLQPRNTKLLVKISRQYALRMNDFSNKEARIASCRKGLAYAERAVASSPDDCEANLSLAICLGKLTPYLGARESVEASRRIKIAAEKAVKADPKNDLAWQLLGRWHQELANIGIATRALAKVIYGGLPAASNEEAVKCFQKAIALNPKRLLHVVELGRTYAMMGQEENARKYLKQGLAMAETDKDDPETKARARASLADVS